MKKAPLLSLLGSMVFAFATTGCSSELDKYADAVCQCKDRKCAEDLEGAMKKQFQGDKRSAEELIRSLTDKDRAALNRSADCASKLQ